MRALTLMDRDPQTSGGLYASSIRPNLENRLLAQTPSVLPQAPSMLSSSWASQPSSYPSLQPSSLSSTISTLLSPSASPLLSTQNTLLKRDPLLFPLTYSVPSPHLHGPLLSTSLTASSGVLPHACFHPSPTLLAAEESRGGAGGGDGGDGGEGGDGGDGGEGVEGGRPCSSEDMQTYSEEMSVVSEQDYLLVDDMVIDNEEPDQTIVTREEVFGEMEQGKDKEEEELKDKKYLLLNEVCSSLVNKSTAPGQKDWDADTSVWPRIKSLANDIATKDPQFLLKVAVYTRQELNIRITANFLLALAASLPASKPHVRRYFCAAVQLPSDWLEVARLYSTCFSRSLPSCLKKALADKFKQFSEYQLAKYNTRKHRCKHNRTKGKGKKPSTKQLAEWANMLRLEPTMLQKYMEGKAKSVVDKKQSEFSLKKMIKKLHIKAPAEHVMAILGMRYPADTKAFFRSGLSGVWDRERAGLRMKLKQPETWERKLSQEGNKAVTWEKLIDNKSLPFMAMLRNLRNMISQGISEKHHQHIMGRLTNKKEVIQSRQFPFRFLSAYKVIMELGSTLGSVEKAPPTTKEILLGILQKLPKSKRYGRLDWETAGRKRVRLALGVPFIYRIYNIKRSLLRDGQRLYTAGLLERYRKALETAVQISCRFNVPPLPGTTLIFLERIRERDVGPWTTPDFCCPPDPEAETEGGEGGQEDFGQKKKKKKEKDDFSVSMNEVAVLLSLMIAFSAEDPHLNYLEWTEYSEMKLNSDVLLDNVRSVTKQMRNDNMKPLSSLFSKMSQENKVDTIIVLAERGVVSSCFDAAIHRYRKESNSSPLVVKVYLADGCSRTDETPVDRNCVELSGFSEQILRFVAERGSSRLLEHVEHMDKLHHIPAPQGAAKDPDTAAAVTQIPPSPKLRWRGVRVFISSTFRDMHAERDMLVRSVFPELRRRAAPHCLYLQEVELRWGVTEEESSRTVELCLSEVCRSQMLLGILGERYGLVPSRPSLPDLPQYSWLDSAPSGLSVTEMEIRQFQALYPDMENRTLFYFRAPDLARSVPVSWKSDFAAESKEAESKMSGLKSRIRKSGVKVTENYPCEWGGVVDGKPYVKGLEEFGKAVLEDLWQAVQKQFVEEADETDVGSDISEQEVHQGALQRRFFGRAKVLFGTVGKVQETQLKGGLVLLEGAPGEGKTVFMAALANALRTPDKTRKTPTCHVISYSTAATQSAHSVENLLRCLVQWLRRRKAEEENPPLPSSYKDLLAEFHSNLSDTRRDQPLALLIDGAELVQDSRGQLSSDWIPQQLPQGVCLVLSVTSSSDLLQTLAKKKGAILMPLGPLSLPDRKDIVQKELDVYGKKLSDSAFNNQLQTLLMKKGAVSPLYLHLACEDLRNFASFEKIRESLQALPQSLCELVLCSLRRLESQYGRDYMVGAAAALTFSRTDLRERDLYVILNMWMELTSRDEVTWQEVLHLSRKPKQCIPMATFTHMVRSLQSLIGLSHCPGPDDLLALTNPEVRRGFENFVLLVLPESMRDKTHLLIAAHLWVRSDPQGTDTFLHCEANCIKHLLFHLEVSGQWATARLLLSNYHFLFANVRHGLLHHVLEKYSVYSKRSEFVEPAAGAQGLWEDCWRFLQRHAPLLSTWPALFVQQALNEPQDAPAHAWAQGLQATGPTRVVKWLNSAKHAQGEASELVSTFLSEPTCVAVSPRGDKMVVGTGEGTLHLIHTETGQEAMSLVSSCDGVSGCLFLGESLLATASFDGRIETWDIQSGCRTSLIKAHSNRITGCDVSADRKHLATVSLDFNVKVWSSPKGSLVATLVVPSPLNCVNFHPEGQLLAAGAWDGAVRVWNWLRDEVVMTLTGHQTSVRSLSFSPYSPLLSSGCLSGEVRLWSVPASTCVGRYQAHVGSTEVLSFQEEGELLVSAGSDHKVKLWSGGIGRSVNVFGNEKETPRKGQRSTATVPPALCVAVAGDMAAVGYHGDGVKLFSLESGELTWASEDLRVSIPCLMWLAAAEEGGEEPELLVSGGGDQRLRVWGRSQDRVGGAMELRGRFGAQHGPILALAQNASHLASASDDCTIALWATKDMTSEPWVDPCVVSVLRGHSGGVTCLAFSPSGEELLSGGKDQALLVWNVSTSPPALSKSLPHCHGDWLTGCVWTPNCVLSCSSDCKIRMWDLQTGRSVREILGRSPLSSVFCLGEFVMAGCAEGSLHIWKWESGLEISRISAHKSRIHHSSVLPRSDKTKEGIQDDMIVATASSDGTVKLWNPFQVHHHSTLEGHSGGIHGAVFRQEGDPAILTVSEDRSLRSWSITMAKESPPNQAGVVTALCFSLAGDLLLSGYKSGCVQIWQHNSMVGHKQASDSSITAVCFMPDGQWAVACRGRSVSVWRLEWNPQHSSASLVKLSTHSVEHPITHMHYCSFLTGFYENGEMVTVIKDDGDYNYYSWDSDSRVLGMMRNDEKSIWVVAEKKGQLALGFMFAMGKSSFSVNTLDLDMDQSEGQGWVSASAVEGEFVVCGDSKGNMWFNTPPDLTSWSTRKPAHSDRITVLRFAGDNIISASRDRTVKLWDRNTKKQVGLFVCGAPVLLLEVNPQCSSDLVCGDGLGQIYFLSLRE